jgi:elongation factor Ts
MVMVEISASMVKELREKSGAAMMDCKKALVEASGDFEKAFELLRQKGVATAGKKADRVASEGLVVGKVTADGREGALVEVNCETDFVARNEQFGQLTTQIIDLLLKSKSKDPENFLSQSHGGGTVKDLVTEAISKTGENILIRRLATFDLQSENGIIGLYVHALGGKMGALVEISSSNKVDTEKLSALAREVAMHVVSAKPQFMSREQVPADVVENERRIESGKADLAEKKPEMREKIVGGRVDKIMAERCLLEQPFVKDPGQSVSKYLAAKGQELGTELKPVRFALFILGEALQESNGKSE